METMIHVGPRLPKEATKEVSETILRILEARVDQKTMRAALLTLRETTVVRNVDITGCHLSTDRRIQHFHADVDPETADTLVEAAEARAAEAEAKAADAESAEAGDDGAA